MCAWSDLCASPGREVLFYGQVTICSRREARRHPDSGRRRKQLFARLRRVKQWILEDFVERSVATGGSYGPAVAQRLIIWQAAGSGSSRFSSTQDFGTLEGPFCDARSWNIGDCRRLLEHRPLTECGGACQSRDGSSTLLATESLCALQDCLQCTQRSIRVSPPCSHLAARSLRFKIVAL